jgi:hypothetical protein
MRPPRAALVALLLLSGACDFYYYRLPSPDDLWRIIPWFDQMVYARYIWPYETDRVPRHTPEGSVPVSGGEPDWSAEWISGKTTTVNALKNPFATGGSGRCRRYALPDLLQRVSRTERQCRWHGIAPDRRAIAADCAGPRVQRWLYLQHHSLRAGRYAALW